MRKKRSALNPHAVAQLILAVAASIMLGALAGRVMVAVSKTPAYHERKAELTAFVTGKRRLDQRKSQRLAAEPYRSHVNNH